MCFSSVNSTIFANVFGRFCHVFSVTKLDDYTLFIPLILRNDGYLNLLDIYSMSAKTFIHLCNLMALIRSYLGLIIFLIIIYSHVDISGEDDA